MSITLNNIINYGSCRFKVVKFATSEDIGQIQNALSSIKTNPPGTIISFAGNSTPNGYLLCDGSAISRTTYNDLFDAIGTTYGTGNGETTFNIPNLTDLRYLEGNTSSGIYHGEGLPNITGSINAYNQLAGYAGTGSIYAVSNTRNSGANGVYYGSTSAGTLYFDASRSNSIYGNSIGVRPKSLTVRFMIKY